jgi:hypothetical protein
VDDNEIGDDKNEGKLLAILIAMAMQQYNAGRITRSAHQGLHWKPLDAAIGQVPALYRPGGRHGQRIC